MLQLGPGVIGGELPVHTFFCAAFLAAAHGSSNL